MSANPNEIDKAIAVAQARKAARGEKPAETTEPTQGKAAAPRRPRLSDEEKQARDAAKAEQQATAKAARAAARAEKQAAKAATRRPAHLAKVKRAAELLAPLGQAATLLFNEATANLTASELASLASHIVQFNREKATIRALSVRLTVGQRVRIVGGDPRLVGKEGTVTKAQRIRAYVQVDGASKPTYVFTSDVEPIAAQAAASNG